MSRRASLPGAEELFRRTSGAERARTRPRPRPPPKDDKSTKLQVAEAPARSRAMSARRPSMARR